MQQTIRRSFVFLLCAMFSFVSFSSRLVSQPPAQSKESPLKKRIPPADPSKYRAVQDARDWRNPYLMVQAKGIDVVRPANDATKRLTMSPSEVLAYLEKLPASAWPYGLIVAVSENGVRGPGDDVPIKKNREELVRLLENAGIKVDLWPSA